MPRLKESECLMNVDGFDTIAALLEQDAYLSKMLANERGVVLFPHTIEHRDAKQSGIQDADDSGGNALAAMVKPGRIEFRFHYSFSDERVRQLTKRMLTHPEMQFAAQAAVTYQARALIRGGRRNEPARGS